MDAYIVKAYRSAVGKAKKGGFKNYRSDDLAVDVVKYMMEQSPEVDPHIFDDVIVVGVQIRKANKVFKSDVRFQFGHWGSPSRV